MEKRMENEMETREYAGEKGWRSQRLCSENWTSIRRKGATCQRQTYFPTNRNSLKQEK